MRNSLSNGYNSATFTVHSSGFFSLIAPSTPASIFQGPCVPCLFSQLFCKRYKETKPDYEWSNDFWVPQVFILISECLNGCSKQNLALKSFSGKAILEKVFEQFGWTMDRRRSMGIRITCPCDLYPLTPHFYIVKLGFTGVFIFLTCTQNLCFEQKYKKYNFSSANYHFYSREKLLYIT